MYPYQNRVLIFIQLGEGEREPEGIQSLLKIFDLEIAQIIYPYIPWTSFSHITKAGSESDWKIWSSFWGERKESESWRTSNIFPPSSIFSVLQQRWLPFTSLAMTYSSCDGEYVLFASLYQSALPTTSMLILTPSSVFFFSHGSLWSLSVICVHSGQDSHFCDTYHNCHRRALFCCSWLYLSQYLKHH